MYALFPLLICASIAAMLGSWVLRDAGLRRMPLLRVPGWLLVALLPLTVVGFVAAGWPGVAAAARADLLRWLMLPVAVLLICAGVSGAIAARRADPRTADEGIVGRGLLTTAAAIIAVSYLLSLALALTNSTL